MDRVVPATVRNSDTDCQTWLAEGLSCVMQDATAGAGQPAGAVAPVIAGSDLLYRLTQAGDIDRARALCEHHAMVSEGGRRAVYADFILPVVRAIEADWKAGAAPFEDIIAHFWSVQRLTDGMADAPAQAMPQPARGSVLLARPQSEDHGFGLCVVAEEFRAAGWHVTTEKARDNRQIVDRLGDDALDAVGLSVGHDATLHGLADLVQDMRLASRNPRLRVILGGHVVATAPDSYGFLGADLVARTAAEAVDWLGRSAAPAACAGQGHA